uniref:EVE domain-containing protein n=1 Tax=Kalanchoe fedtschenkoi TaxID=63787 RepID=A0A7N0TNY2_KALFE
MHIAARPLISSRAFPMFSKPPNPTRPAETLATRVMGGGAAQRWLLKTEPHEWSWSDQAANGGISNWDGVRNKQAQKNMKSMKVGDLCFFYHSGRKARCVVGVVEVVKEWYEDGGGGAVDVREVGEMRRRVGLEEMKRDEGLKGFEMFRQPRLSVVRVSEEVWVRVCEIGGGFVGDGRVDEGDLEGEVDEAGDPSS